MNPRVWPAACLLVLAGAIADARAEETPVIPVTPLEEEREVTNRAVRFDDIIVTASKREVASRELPASVAALDGGWLEGIGAGEMRDYLRSVPGIQLTELQPDLFRVAIRGIQADVSAVTPETEGIFIDDVPLNDPFLMLVRPDLPTFDLERVEVLKGPQGTLFGGSGLAGAIRYHLRDAQPGQWELRGFGQDQSPRDGSRAAIGGVAMNVPFGDTAAARLVGIRNETGGTIDDTRNGLRDTDASSTVSQRALVRWNPDHAWSVGAKFYRQVRDADDLPWADTQDGRLERSQRLQKSPSFTRFSVGALDLRHAGPWGEWVSITGAMAKDSSLLNAYGEQAMGTQDSGQAVTYPTTDDTQGFTQELRLASPADDAWQWLVGAYGQRYHSVSQQHVYVDNGASGPSLLDFHSDVTAHEWAVFGETRIDLGTDWRLTTGARAYRVNTEGTIDSSGPIILVTGNSENHHAADQRASGVNPKLALEWRARPDLRAYAGVARGFRFGGIQLVGPSPAAPDVPTTYRSDRLWSYEAGLRSDWLDGFLRVDGAVFLIDWRDPQVQMTTTGAVELNIIDNAGRARSQGAELIVRGLTPIPGMTVEVSGAYTDARITVPYVGQGAEVPAGSRLPGSSDRQAAAALQYGRNVGALRLEADARYAYLGPGVSDIRQSMPIYDYDTVDVRVRLEARALALHPSLTVGLLNLLDERALVSAYYIDQDNMFTVYNRPRTLDVRLALAL